MVTQRPDPPEQEISWRTEELGPEARRRLFEKLVPSAQPGIARVRPAAKPKDPGPSRPKTPKSGD